VGFVRGCDGVGKSRQEGRQAVGMQSSIVETPLVSCCVIFLSETMQLCMSTACSKRHIGMFVPRYRLLFGISPFCFSPSGKKQKGRTRGIHFHLKKNLFPEVVSELDWRIWEDRSLRIKPREIRLCYGVELILN
jgi:hypothetical protein